MRYNVFKIRKNNGFVLIFFYLVVVLLLVFAATFYFRSVTELTLTERQRMSIQAFGVAEAGIERAFYELRKDFENGGASPSWADGSINGMACGPDTANFYALPFSSTSLGNGSYVVELKNISGKPNEIWIRSTGTVGDASKAIQAYVKMVDVSPWQNVIFGGTGAAGAAINGNVNIQGSVHILGDGLGPNDLAMDMSGTGTVGNNYAVLPPELDIKIPPCPLTQFNGEWIESLGAEVRVKHGQVGLSGTATIASPDVFGNAHKETAEGTFITDGFGGNAGATNVYSDNGTQNVYDLGESVSFPSLSDPYGGYATYQEYLRDNALVITDPAQLNQIANMNPGSTFNYSSAEGSISMDGNGNLTIDGIVYIDGGDLNIRKQGADKTINYTGRGSMLVTGNVGVNVNLYTQGNNSFPSNILGIMTPNSITFNEANIDVMGLFYAEDTVNAQKQTDIAGALLSNYFDMGTNVPSVFQVPSVIDNLPPGMIGSTTVWFIKIVSWQKL